MKDCLLSAQFCCILGTMMPTAETPRAKLYDKPYKNKAANVGTRTEHLSRVTISMTSTQFLLLRYSTPSTPYFFVNLSAFDTLIYSSTGREDRS